MRVPILDKRRERHYEERVSDFIAQVRGLDLPEVHKDHAIAQVKEQREARRLGALGPITDSSQSLFQAVAAPGATTVISTVAYVPSVTPFQSLWQLDLQIILAGTTEVALNNLRLRFNDFSATSNITTLPTVTGANLMLTYARFPFPKAGILTVETIAASTAGSVYMAGIMLTRVG